MNVLTQDPWVCHGSKWQQEGESDQSKKKSQRNRILPLGCLLLNCSGSVLSPYCCSQPISAITQISTWKDLKSRPTRNFLFVRICPLSNFCELWLCVLCMIHFLVYTSSLLTPLYSSILLSPFAIISVCLEGRIIGNLDTLLKQTEFLHSDHLEKCSETQALNELSFTQVQKVQIFPQE